MDPTLSILPAKANKRSEELFKQQAVRQLTPSAKWEKSGRKLDGSLVYRLEGALIFTRGEERLGGERCLTCQDGNGAFSGCVTVHGRSMCATCIYANHKCSLTEVKSELAVKEEKLE